LNITWDPQWLLITRLFHPLFPSTPSTMLPPHPAAQAALASAAAACDLVPPLFELPMAPVVDPAANLQVCRCALAAPHVAATASRCIAFAIDVVCLMHAGRLQRC